MDQLINSAPAPSRYTKYFIIYAKAYNFCSILLPNFEINIYPRNNFYQEHFGDTFTKLT